MAIQGFGNVGTHTAKYLHENQCSIVAVSGTAGGFYRPDGLNLTDALHYTAEHGSLRGYEGGEHITNEQVLELDVELLVPAALGGVITGENAPRVKAAIIAEGANGPVHPDADEIFDKNRQIVLPDILVNAGGVTASYFEWAQNRQHYRWDLSRVRQELETVLTQSFEQVWDLSKQRKISLRTAAYIVGIERVGRATVLGGII